MLYRVKAYLKHAKCFIRTGYWPTGERVDPETVDDNFINHLKVYKFIAQMVRGQRVLDVGCGTGYGTDYLRQNGAQITGIDYLKSRLKLRAAPLPGSAFFADGRPETRVSSGLVRLGGQH